MNSFRLIASVVLTSVLPVFLACAQEKDADDMGITQSSASASVSASSTGFRRPMRSSNIPPENTTPGTINAMGTCPATLPHDDGRCEIGSFTTCEYDGQLQCKCAERGGGTGRTWDCYAADAICPAQRPPSSSQCTDVTVVCSYTASAEQCKCVTDGAGHLYWNCGDGVTPPVFVEPDAGASASGTVSVSPTQAPLDAAVPAASTSDGAADVPDSSEPPDSGINLSDTGATELDTGTPVLPELDAAEDASSMPDASDASSADAAQ